MLEQRPVIVSCDGHATGRPDDYLPYIDPAYRGRYEEFAREIKAQRAARRKAQQEGNSLFSDAGSFGLDKETGDARDGEWNSRLRAEVLEGEGVVAEVLFPNGGVPFGGFGESAEHAMPVHIHGGGGTPDYGNYGIASMLMYATEATFFSQRNLWILIWSGVLDRFPRMQVVFTEARADWVPNTLMLLDGIHAAPFFRNIEKTARQKPSEYFERKVTIAASFMNSHEASLRHAIGVGNLMWGADFPHVEGTWPRTRKSLARCFAGVPSADVRAILTDNPARIYGFDVAALQPIADRVGPTMEELVGKA